MGMTPTLFLKTRLFQGREREMFYLTTHSTHFIYGYMASDIWLRTIMIVRKETRCRHIGYSYRLAARVLLYAPSHRQDNTYHGLCYTSRGALAGTRNSSTGVCSKPVSYWQTFRDFARPKIDEQEAAESISETRAHTCELHFLIFILLPVNIKFRNWK